LWSSRANRVTLVLQSHNNISHLGASSLAEPLKTNAYLSFLDLVRVEAGAVHCGVVLSRDNVTVIVTVVLYCHIYIIVQQCNPLPSEP
jgi:hypothetical protein